MKRMDFRDKWVLVTGASAGLGREMARQLARDHKANLVLVARRADRLNELKKELEQTHGVQAEALAADLSKLEDVDRVFAQATAGRSIYGAILNAGVTHFGEHRDLPWDAFQSMLNTNVISVVRLTSLFVPHLERANDGGGLMLVSSMTGLTPLPYQTAYSSTKAFLVNFGLSLHHELDGKNVSLTTYAPGGILTEMAEMSGTAETLGGWLMPVDRAARSAIRAFARRKYLHVPGFVYALGTYFMRLLPQRFVTARVAATYRKALRQLAAKNVAPGDGRPAVQA